MSRPLSFSAALFAENILHSFCADGSPAKAALLEHTTHCWTSVADWGILLCIRRPKLRCTDDIISFCRSSSTLGQGTVRTLVALDSPRSQQVLLLRADPRPPTMSRHQEMSWRTGGEGLNTLLMGTFCEAFVTPKVRREEISLQSSSHKCDLTLV